MNEYNLLRRKCHSTSGLKRTKGKTQNKRRIQRTNKKKDRTFYDRCVYHGEYEK